MGPAKTLLLTAVVGVLGSPLFGSAQTQFESRRTAVSGGELFYRIGGQGKPLLMLHGMTGVGSEWDRYAERLAEWYTVIVPDLPGHGHSTNERGEFLVPDVVDALVELLDDAGVDRFAGVGYSIGGMTLLHMARSVPERLEAMVVVAGGHRISPERREALRNAPSFEDLSQREREWYVENHPGGEAQVRALLAQRRALAGNYVDLSADDLSEIEVPSFLVWGENDESFQPPIPFELQQGLPTAELWLVANQGHSLLWPEWGGSERVLRLLPDMVVEFLRQAGY